MKKLHIQCESWTVFRVFFRNLIFEVQKTSCLQSYSHVLIGLAIVRPLKKVPISERGRFRLLANARSKDSREHCQAGPKQG